MNDPHLAWGSIGVPMGGPGGGYSGGRGGPGGGVGGPGGLGGWSANAIPKSLLTLGFEETGP